jgi:Cys-tRNA(Pro)/Cys-tRNA(Cys) deacylase
MSKSKENKTNAMRILERMGGSFRAHVYECDKFIDGRHTVELLGMPAELFYKTLVTEGRSREYFVFVIPIESELSLKKAARAVEVKSLAMIPVKDITQVTGYVRGGCTAIGMKRRYPVVIDSSAQLLESMIVSGGRLGLQLELSPADLCRAAEACFADVVE